MTNFFALVVFCLCAVFVNAAPSTIVRPIPKRNVSSRSIALMFADEIAGGRVIQSGPINETLMPLNLTTAPVTVSNSFPTSTNLSLTDVEDEEENDKENAVPPPKPSDYEPSTSNNIEIEYVDENIFAQIQAQSAELSAIQRPQRKGNSLFSPISPKQLRRIHSPNTATLMARLYPTY